MSDDTTFLGGNFLVSEIALVDPNFRQTVVLMVSHDDNGAFGLVVNRPSPFTLGDVIDGMEDCAARSIPVFIGGPVQQEILFSCMPRSPGSRREENAEEPAEGVVWNGDPCHHRLSQERLGSSIRRTNRRCGCTPSTRAGAGAGREGSEGRRHGW